MQRKGERKTQLTVSVSLSGIFLDAEIRQPKERGGAQKQRKTYAGNHKGEGSQEKEME